MQKTESYWDGHKLFIQDRVIPDKETVKSWYFIVRSDSSHHSYFVRIDKDTLEDNCLCEHGSQWRFDNSPNRQERVCKHLWACRIWLREHRGVVWSVSQ